MTERNAAMQSHHEKFETIARKLARPILACAAHENGLHTMPVTQVGV